MDVARNLSGLVVTAGARACALPIEHVVETMRPLPVEPMPGAPKFVLGLATVRGAPLPVVGLSALLGVASPRTPTRFVTVRVAARSVSLAVDAVEGVVALDRAKFEALPPLVRDAGDAIEALAPLDDRFLLVLRAARLLRDEVS